ncbi:STAS domain-containing protein [Planobispora siamensis]|uniref:Anti-sigma factor antagonist n=1 Tax=Planobispora siamensis TaxID=936338 RepID=A0A8J3SM51_9ACTN|nr:STAS domain-containing protein [Planobispora siamensis]GIH96772.1 hypothetical protein Psi01_74020 [Planobispora siamensis]
MSVPLTVAETPFPDDLHHTVITVAGDLEKPSVHLLRKVADQAITNGRTKIILNVHGVTFCDSTGLRELLTLLRQTYENSGWLRLAGVTGVLERLMTLTRLYDAFPVDPDLNASLRYVYGRDLIPETPPGGGPR